MYDFQSLRKNATNTEMLPTVAINFNGYQLDTLLDSFTTLKVAGRETLSNDLETVDIQNGSMILGNRLPSRELVITYLLQNNDNEAFQKDFKQLRKYLTSNGNVAVSFRDEPNTYFYGMLSEMETVPDDKNAVISTFTIFCDSPFKYGQLVTTTGAVTVETFYETLPEKITLTVSTTTNNISISNGSKTISASGTFNAGSVVVFWFDKYEMRMTVNGAEATYMIDLNSAFENFTLTKGQSVTSSNGTIQLVQRERWL